MRRRHILQAERADNLTVQLLEKKQHVLDSRLRDLLIYGACTLIISLILTRFNLIWSDLPFDLPK